MMDYKPTVRYASTLLTVAAAVAACSPAVNLGTLPAGDSEGGMTTGGRPDDFNDSSGGSSTAGGGASTDTGTTGDTGNGSNTGPTGETDGSETGDGPHNPDGSAPNDPAWPHERLGEPPADCACLIDTDQCWDGLRCMDSTITCSPVQGCADGYECINSACVCNDLDICGIACAGDDDCGTFGRCDHNFGVCRHELSCLDDSQCDDGEACLPVDYGKIPFIDEYYQRSCQAVGTRQYGESCNEGIECQSGTCREVCTTSCTSNSDCPDNLVCGWAYDGRQGCILPAATDCDNSCGEAENYCPSPYPGCTQSCTQQSDCPSDTRCRRHARSPENSFCDDTQDPCPGANEFGFWAISGADSEQCFVDTACWSHQDCPVGYECQIPVENDTGIQTILLTGYCARVP